MLKSTPSINLKIMKTNAKLKPIHVVQASQMNKILLLIYVYGANESKYINLDIKPEFRKENDGNYHAPSHVQDSRRKKPVNLIQEGVKRGLIYQTN